MLPCFCERCLPDACLGRSVEAGLAERDGAPDRLVPTELGLELGAVLEVTSAQTPSCPDRLIGS